MTRVLFIGAFPPEDSLITGGIVTSCRALLRSSFATRFELLLLDSTQRSIPEPGIAVRALIAARRVARFIGFIERRKPDVVLAFTSQGASFVEKSLCAWYARLRGVPTVLLMRGGPFMDDVRSSRKYRFVAGLLLKGAAIIPCQGEAWRRFFNEEFGIENWRLPIVYNWTASEEYLAMEPVRGHSQRRLCVLFLAWIDREKGVFELLDAAEELWRASGVPAFELRLVGGGRHLDELRAQVRARGLEDRVHFHGWAGTAEKRDLYRAADIFVLPSHSEGMPNSMIEAMSMAVPVVVTPVGSVADVIQNGVNGVLTPVGQTDALREALGDLLSSPEKRGRIGDVGRETARQLFGLEQGVAALSSTISLAIEGRRERDFAR